LLRFGTNILPDPPSKSFLQLLWEAFRDPTIIILTGRDLPDSHWFFFCVLIVDKPKSGRNYFLGIWSELSPSW